MSILVNLFGDCAAQTRGSGLGDCLKQFGDLTGVDVVKKRTLWNLTTDTFDETLYKTAIQSDTLYPFNNVYNFAQNTPENERATGSTGLLTDIRGGKPQFDFDYDSGYCNHKNAYDKNGKNRWDLILKFETGAFFATDVAEENLKGFDNGLFSVATFKIQQGSDPEMTKVTVQFNNAVELNTRGVFLTWEALGFDGNQINGAINTNLSYVTAPAAAATTISVQVSDDCNRSAYVQGLTNVNNWVLGGTQATPTAITAVVYNAATNAYDITIDTPLAAADTVQPALADVAGSYTTAVNASGDFYKGSAAVATA